MRGPALARLICALDRLRDVFGRSGVGVHALAGDELHFLYHLLLARVLHRDEQSIAVCQHRYQQVVLREAARDIAQVFRLDTDLIEIERGHAVALAQS